MIILQLLPVILAHLLFSAHILRFYGLIPALIIVLLLGTLAIRNKWTMRIWQFFLMIQGLVWVGYTADVVQYRLVMDMNWIRLVIIMSIIVLFTIFSIFWLQSKNLKSYFGLQTNGGN